MPLFSIFTPTHDPKFLPRLEASLAKQICQDFEWIVVPNGKTKQRGEVPGVTIPQARVCPLKTTSKNTGNIGFIKKFACAQATGEILVEVDHDDELTPDCLSELAVAFSDSQVDFAYSNCCDIRQDTNQPVIFDKSHGWVYRPFNYNGLDTLECVAFEPTPASFAKIWYAPNHVRAWRRTFYERIGGYNENLDILDDHDILCRTYIAGNVRHIDKCLYIYYHHQQNTCKGDRNARIQTQTQEIHDQYIYQLVEKWCDLNGLRKIDLCSGIYPAEGYEGVDIAGGDIVADLNERWPFEDGSIGVLRAHDALEHLKDPLHTMLEAYRCLAPNGWFLTKTPSTDGRGAFCDPTHVSYWNSMSFRYYTERLMARYIDTPVKFQAARLKDYYPEPTEWHRTHNIVYTKADLLKFDGRTPGQILI